MKPIMSEKIVRIMELENKLLFEISRHIDKEELKKEIEEMFNVKVESIKTLIKNNKKRAYVKLKKEFKAIDVAAKLGMI